MARVDDAQDAGNPRRGEASGSGRTGSSWRRSGCGQSLLLLGPVGLRLDPLVKRQTALTTHRTPHGVDTGEPQHALLPRLVRLLLWGIRGFGLRRDPENLRGGRITWIDPRSPRRNPPRTPIVPRSRSLTPPGNPIALAGPSRAKIAASTWLGSMPPASWIGSGDRHLHPHGHHHEHPLGASPSARPSTPGLDSVVSP